jgi:hypothetical protein
MPRYLVNVMSTYEVIADDEDAAFEGCLGGRLVDTDALIADVITEGS